MFGLTVAYYAAFIIAGYLSGSILWSKILARLFGNHDITKEHSDKNPGASNVFRSCGVVAGSSALLLDLLKGFLPVYAALFFVSPQSFLFSVIAAAPVIGHIFPLFFRFKGGKAIASSFGVLIGLSFVTVRPLLILVSLYIFFSVFVVFRSHMWRSVIVFAAFGFLSSFLVRDIYAAVACVIIAFAVFLRHYLSRDKNDAVSVSFCPWLFGKNGEKSE